VPGSDGSSSAQKSRCVALPFKRRCPAIGGASVLGGSDPPVCRAITRLLVERVPILILIGHAVSMVFGLNGDPKVVAQSERMPQLG
jgi:hypothetical protein